MLPHTGLFLLWKVALQMRIRRCLKTLNLVFRQPFKAYPNTMGSLINPTAPQKQATRG